MRGGSRKDFKGGDKHNSLSWSIDLAKSKLPYELFELFVTEMWIVLETDLLISRGCGFYSQLVIFLPFCTTSYFFQKLTETSFLENNTLKSGTCK